MANKEKCGSEHPETCRYHGHAATAERQQQAAVQSGDLDGYLKASQDRDAAAREQEYQQQVAARQAKRARIRLNHEHRLKLRDQFEVNEDYRDMPVTVFIKGDDDVHSPMGDVQSYSGVLQEEGGWLVIDGVQVKNLTTGQFNDHLHGIRKG